MAAGSMLTRTSSPSPLNRIRMTPTLRRLPAVLLAAAVALTSACSRRAPVERPGPAPQRYRVVPWPQRVDARPGAFTVNAGTRLVLSDPASPELRAVAAFLSDYIRSAVGAKVSVSDSSDSLAQAGRNAIALQLRADAAVPAEGYRLSVTPDSVTLTASKPAGLFHGVQTLRQLLPVRGEGGSAIPAVEIEDAPRFAYRGMHLDVGRHFFPASFVKRYVDLLAMYKFNTFHWHLTEDQGWRIQIKRYPRLTEVGGCRKETQVAKHRDPFVGDGTRYCGYYTQDEVRDVVAYAAARHVTILPEIEMPGHSVAAITAYPELGCRATAPEVRTKWGISDDILCPTEETFAFLEGVLTEVMELFPGERIHIGGDEAPKQAWQESPAAQAVIRREGLKDEHELQSYFVRRIEKFLNAHGRRLVGWDEIVEGGLSPTATVMYWRDRPDAGVGVQGGIDPARVAVKQGNSVIMTPNQTLYFDRYQADSAGEPLAIGGLATLRQVYDYDPIPSDFGPEEAKRVLGAQANVWTEYMATPEHVEYMVLPRMIALAEVVWSPREARDWDSFTRRLPAQLKRLDALGVKYRAP